MTWARLGWSRRSTSFRSISESASAPRRHCWIWLSREADTIPLDPAPGTRFRRMTWTIGAAVVLYLCILVLLWLFEPYLIYFPGQQRSLVPPPARLRLPIERVEIPTEDGVKLVGWVIQAPS